MAAKQYRVVFDYDYDKVPFGKDYKSKPYSKRDAWNYVKRLKQRAGLSGVKLCDIAIVDMTTDDVVWTNATV